MANDMLNEKINDLFKSLMLESDIEEERKILKENGIDFNSEDLENFHKKKQELFVVLKENKKGLQKLSTDDMSNVSGGSELGNLLTSLSSALCRLIAGGSWQDAVDSGVYSYLMSSAQNVTATILRYLGYDEDFIGPFLPVLVQAWRTYNSGES